MMTLMTCYCSEVFGLGLSFFRDARVFMFWYEHGILGDCGLSDTSGFHRDEYRLFQRLEVICFSDICLSSPLCSIDR